MKKTAAPENQDQPAQPAAQITNETAESPGAMRPDHEDHRQGGTFGPGQNEQHADDADAEGVARRGPAARPEPPTG